MSTVDRLIFDPPIREWSLSLRADAVRNGDQMRGRDQWVQLINRNVSRLGIGTSVEDGRVLLATGHQAGLWHPGILAKFLALDIWGDALKKMARGSGENSGGHSGGENRTTVVGRTAEKTEKKAGGKVGGGEGVFWVVADQDANAAWTFEVPVVRGDELTTRRVDLAKGAGVAVGNMWRGAKTGVATSRQKAVRADVLLAGLETLRASSDVGKSVVEGGDAGFGNEEQLDLLADAIKAMPDESVLENQAAQLAWVLDYLMRERLGISMPVVFASQLNGLTPMRELITAMRDDALQCVQAYNTAVRQYPEAGMTRLRIDPMHVELPLWRLHDQGRDRVFADMADSKTILVNDRGDEVAIDDAGLAPRALLLTALMRGYGCDLFIHGTGGGVYDQVTEQWWSTWRGEKLSAGVVASCDLRMEFDVPVADQTAVEQAVWRAHHVRHNLDQESVVQANEADSVAQKRALLRTMDDDRDVTRRAKVFEQIHALNDALAQRYPALIQQADTALERARQGLLNHEVAHRRDWFWGLYDDAGLQSLRGAIAKAIQ